ncbi:MAG: BamA/TamA family outer membrane protein, partial [Gemmatimonadales bacterium]
IAQYANLSRRLNWGVGIQQQPYFFYDYSTIEPGPTDQEATYVTNVRRLVLRDISTRAYYPFSRFSRVEGSVSFANLSDDLLQIREPYFIGSGIPSREPFLETNHIESITYLAPSLAYVHDNSLSAYVGPFLGRRSRFEVSQNLEVIGSGWRFTSVTADMRRYDRLVGNVTLATRGMFVGRMGRDENRFRFYGGNTELIRGYTAGSFNRNECREGVDENSFSGCGAFDELIGSRAAVFNAEVRVPIFAPGLGLISLGNFPAALEAAIFFDAGVFWERGMTVSLNPDRNVACAFDPATGQAVPGCVRTPLTSYGFSLRTNLLNILILRLDYAIPLQRSVGGMWTISLGPTF